LLPSAHRYDFVTDLRSDTALLPLKIRGQRDYSGKALCRGHVKGMPLGVDMKDVDSSPKKPKTYWPFIWPLIGLIVVFMVSIATTGYIEN